MKLTTALCSLLLVASCSGCVSAAVKAVAPAAEPPLPKFKHVMASFMFDTASDQETYEACTRTILNLEEIYGKHDAVQKEAGGLIVSWNGGEAVAVCSLEAKGLIFTTELVKEEPEITPPPPPGTATL